MRKIKKSEIDCDEWIKSMISKRWDGEFRYFSSIAVHRKDYKMYRRWLRKCEKLSLQFELGYIETETDYGVLWEFSMFEMPAIGNSVAVSHSFEEKENEIIFEMAKEKFEKSKSFIFAESCSFSRNKHDAEYWDMIMDIVNEY